MFRLIDFLKRFLLKLIGLTNVLEIGDELHLLLNEDKEEKFREYIDNIEIAKFKKLGYLVPDLIIVNNKNIDKFECRFYFNNKAVNTLRIYPKRMAIFDYQFKKYKLKKKIPASAIKYAHYKNGLYLYWLKKSDCEKIKKVIKKEEAITILLNCYDELLSENIEQVLTKSCVKQCLEYVKQEYSAQVVKDLLKQLDIEDIKTVFCNLIQKEISIRDLLFVVENLAIFAKYDKDTDSLTQKMAEVLKRI